MKNIKDILFITQARLESQRVPKKMTKPFCGTNLLHILINKIKKSKIIPLENFYLSVCDKELIDIAKEQDVNYFERSRESALAENSVPLIYEWHDKLDFKYVCLISACNPLLSIDTIDSFVNNYIISEKDGSFGVTAKKQYFWDESGNMTSHWPEEQKIMNTKTMSTTYEAAHCLYSSRMDIIKDGFWMDDNLPPKPELFVIENEIEVFDIDYDWQFEAAEKLYPAMSEIMRGINK
jgi:CMP-N-acetylneuraminic acid synthetase